MNERQAKKNRKKEEELINSMLTKEVSEATKENIKKKEELLKIIEKNRISLEELQKYYNDNLDKDLMPIDVDKFKIIAENIKKLDAEQRKLKMQVRELEKEISEKVVEINVSEEATDELPVKEIKEKLNKENENIRLEIYDESEEPTFELPRKEIKEELDKSSNIKIECDLKNSIYRIYSPYSESPFIHVVSKELLDPNSKEYKTYKSELIEKHGLDLEYGLDLNIEKAFEKFDKKYNTNIAEAYSTNTFEGKIVYDLRKFSRSKNIIDNDFLSSKEKRALKNIAKNYSKKHDNCDIVQFSNKKAAMLLGSAIVVGAVATSIPSIKTTEEDNNSVVEYLNGMPIDADENDIIYYDKDGNEISKDNTTSSTIDIKTDDSVKEEQTTTEDVFDSSTEDEIIEENDHKDFRVGDIISAEDMENVDLYHLPTDSVSVGNISNWPNIVSYKIAGISPTDISASTYINTEINGELVQFAIRNNNISTEEIKKKLDDQYGPGYNIRLHIMALDENGNVINDQFGWVDLEQLEQENKNVKTR